METMNERLAVKRFLRAVLSPSGISAESGDAFTAARATSSSAAASLHAANAILTLTLSASVRRPPLAVYSLRRSASTEFGAPARKRARFVIVLVTSQF